MVLGEDASKEFKITSGTIIIGRNAGDIPIDDQEVSRQHAQINFFGKKNDLSSRFGLYQWNLSQQQKDDLYTNSRWFFHWNRSVYTYLTTQRIINRKIGSRIKKNLQ